MSFWTADPALSTLIHDTNGSFSAAGYWLKREIEAITSIIPPRGKERLETLDNLRRVEDSLKRLKDSIDYYWNKKKEQYDSSIRTVQDGSAGKPSYGS